MRHKSKNQENSTAFNLIHPKKSNFVFYKLMYILGIISDQIWQKQTSVCKWRLIKNTKLQPSGACASIALAVVWTF